MSMKHIKRYPYQLEDHYTRKIEELFEFYKTSAKKIKKILKKAKKKKEKFGNLVKNS